MLLRGIRWRLGASVLTVLTAALAVGVAVFGPLYLQAAGDSLVRGAIGAASVQTSGLTLIPRPGQPVSFAELQHAERVSGADGRFFGAPISTAAAPVELSAPDGSPLISQLLWRTGICASLHFVAGGCQIGGSDVAVSSRSAAQLHVGLGATIVASIYGARAPRRLDVVGIYTAPNFADPVWWGDAESYFPYGYTTGLAHIPELDALIAARATVLSVPARAAPALSGQLPLRAGAVGIGTSGTVSRFVAGAKSRAIAAGFTISTGVPALLGAAAHQQDQLRTVVLVASAQLILLAVWILGSMLTRSGEARRAELRVAQLRGFPAMSLLSVAIGEPLALCLIGLPIGLVVAVAAVVFARGSLMASGTVVGVSVLSVVALVVTLLVIVAVLGFAASRLVRSSDLSERPARTGVGSVSALADAMLLVLSIVSLVALATTGALGSHGDPIASLAPGLLALGVGVLAARCVGFGCAVAVRRSVDSPRVAWFLGVRQVSRRPLILRQGRVLIIVLCLASFSVSAWSVARSNRQLLSRLTVGAAKVITVNNTGALAAEVAAADPSGRWAMAAVQIDTDSSSLLGVQSARLASVVPWPAGVSKTPLSRLARLLVPARGTSVVLSGGLLTVTAGVSARGAIASRLGQAQLGAWMFSSTAGTTIVDLGALSASRTRYSGSLAYICPSGCRLEGLGVIPRVGQTVPASGSVSVRVRSIGRLPPPRDWTAGATGVGVQAGVSGLSVQVPANTIAGDTGANGSSTPPMAALDDKPAYLPAIVGSGLAALDSSGGTTLVSAEGLDGNTLDMQRVATVSSIPRLGGDATMVDLGMLGLYQSQPTIPAAVDQVWLGPAAPADAVRLLTRAGLRIQSVERAVSVYNRSSKSGPALADDFLLLAMIAALLTAAVGTLAALGSAIKARATEQLMLQLSGVSRRALVCSMVVESSLLVVTTLWGVIAGVVSVALTLPSLPESSSPAPIALAHPIPVGLVLAVTGAVIVIALVCSLGIAAAIDRRVAPDLLRADV